MSASSEPLVSVIVCVYNAGGYFRPAMESVLAQSYPHLEVLIVDDGSTDGCVDAVRDLQDPRVRIIRQENRGKPASMNVALDQIRGDFYIIQDADDLSHPQRVERQLACMRENPDVAAVYCGYDLIFDERRMAPLTRAKTREECRQDILSFRMPSHDPTGMYRWAMVQEFRYSPELRIGEGLDYILRVGEEYPMLVLEDCLYSYRIHRQSLTKRDPALRQSLIEEVLRRARKRRGMDASGTTAMAVGGGGGNRARDNNLAAHFIDSVWSQKQHGRIGAALRTGFQCAKLHPDDPHYWKALVYATLPMPMMQRIRSARAGAVR